MELLNILAVAVALAMDAFAVSVATGVSLKDVSFRQTFRLSWHFGLFQFLMPVIGWGAGLTVRNYIEHYDHWIAFVLLTLVGGKMLWEAFQHETDPGETKDPTRGASLIMLSVATSIDALAVGLSISILHRSVWAPAIVIGIVAGGFTIAGLHLGKKAGSAPGLSRFAEVIGGGVLLAIGIKILFDHGALGIF